MKFRMVENFLDKEKREEKGMAECFRIVPLPLLSGDISSPRQSSTVPGIIIFAEDAIPKKAKNMCDMKLMPVYVSVPIP